MRQSSFNRMFSHFPSVELLQNLVQGSLKQTGVLSQSVRLWIILRSIYGEESDPIGLDLDRIFTYPDWRKAFFGKYDEYHQVDETPKFHDKECPCAERIVDFLFEENEIFPVERQEWENSFCQRYATKKSKTLELLENRPFAVSRRTSLNDFKAIVARGYLRKVGKVYAKIDELPILGNYTKTALLNEEIQFVNEDLREVVQQYLQPVAGVPRFFILLDYISSPEARDRFQELQNRLREIWEKNPIPPIQVKYDSASLWKEVPRIIYPVCIYYYQRAPYLCAYGQTPQNRETLGWYHYRLDRILKIEEIAWDDLKVPSALRKECQNPSSNNTLTPDYIAEELEKALGFDFYRDSDSMLLSFNIDFHDRYIENTVRHTRFERLESKGQIIEFVKRANIDSQYRTKLLDSVCLENFAYYKLKYRVGDNNVIMRLRSWGPNVEVLLPVDLRERMANDLRASSELYR